MTDIFSNLANELKLEIENNGYKKYNPTQKTVYNIGKGKDAVHCMIMTCTSHLMNKSTTFLEDFVDIKPYHKIVTMNETSKLQLEELIIAQMHAALAVETFHPSLYAPNVKPFYQRLETLFEKKESILITEDQCLELSHFHLIYFQYLLKLYLKLPISEILIEETFNVILSISTPSYSKFYSYHSQISRDFILSLSSNNSALAQTLFKIAIDWYASHKHFSIENLRDSWIFNFVYLLSDDELFALQTKRMTSLQLSYEHHKTTKDQSFDTPIILLSELKRIQAWTNKLLIN